MKNIITQYLNVPANTGSISDKFSFLGFTVDNNDIYISAIIRNPNPIGIADLFEYCYWKNGVKTNLQFQENNNNGGDGISVFNGDVYLPAIKNFTVSSNFPTTWDFGYYKNTTFNFLEVASTHVDFVKTQAGLSILYNDFTNFKNINLTTNQTTIFNFTDNIYYVKTDNNEVYYSTGGGYFHNNTYTLIYGGFGYSCDDFEILNGNKYILVNKDDLAGDHGSKIFINDVESFSIFSDLNGIYLGENRFNSITVHQN